MKDSLNTVVLEDQSNENDESPHTLQSNVRQSQEHDKSSPLLKQDGPQKLTKAQRMRRELNNYTKKRMLRYHILKEKNKTRSLPVDSPLLSPKQTEANAHENYTIMVKPVADKKGNKLAENLVKNSSILTGTSRHASKIVDNKNTKSKFSNHNGFENNK